MEVFADEDSRLKHLRQGPHLAIQVGISLAIGIPAFIVFCFLRTKWSKLYQHKRLASHPSNSPLLRDSRFMWVIDLFKVTDEQVLECAGLDAVVFLGFFKMAMKFLASSAFFGMVVIVPVKIVFSPNENPYGNISMIHPDVYGIEIDLFKKKDSAAPDTTWLWSYVAFTYFFSALAWYFLAQETHRITRIRQIYLGNQSTVTDRTVRLSGVPETLRDEAKLASHIEALSIGEVERVVICRSWKELDKRMEERKVILSKLEEAWTVFLSPFRLRSDDSTLPIVQPPPEPGGSDTEDASAEHAQVTDRLLNGHSLPPESRRPKIRMGWFGLFGRRIDCIDYYTIKLRVIDDAINALREEREAFIATPMAFVTFKNVASAQLAAQAVLDPSPLQLVGRLAPAPSDIIWSNVYMSRAERITRNWLVFFLVMITTILWFIPVGALAVLLSPEGINKLSPSFAKFLDEHEAISSVTVGFLPTLAYTVFFALIPFIFNWMSSLQGYLDLTETETSEISKNFAFIFFNYFVVILVASSGYTLLSIAELDTSKIPQLLASILPGQGQFYNNLIVLQGLGMFPFRLLQIGTVTLYPLYKAGCKTPRDFSELDKGPSFNYAFYLPQPLFVFVICTIYSIMCKYSVPCFEMVRADTAQAPPILCFGLIFFTIGYFVHKYQLLFSMDHPQHSTGKALGIIYSRVILGLVIFQVRAISRAISFILISVDHDDRVDLCEKGCHSSGDNRSIVCYTHRRPDCPEQLTLVAGHYSRLL